MKSIIASLAAVAALVSTTLVVDLVVVNRLERELSREIACRLDVEPAHVSAQVGRWHGLTTLANGSVGDVAVSVDDIRVGDLAEGGPVGRPAVPLSASLTVELDDVRRQDPPSRVATGTVEIALAYDQLQDRLRAETGNTEIAVTSDSGRVVVQTGQFGVSLLLAPSIVDDQLQFQVDSVLVGNREVSGAIAQTLRERMSQQQLTDGIDLAGMPDWISPTGVTAADEALVLASEIDPDKGPLTASESCQD